MKVLIFIDWFTPGYKAGGPTKSIVNFVNHLKHQIDLYVLTSDTDYCETKPYSGIESDRWLECNSIHVCYLEQKTLSTTKVEAMVRQADCPVWYLNGIYSRYFSILPLWLAKKFHPEKLVIAPRGMLSPQTFKSKGISKHIFLTLMRFSGLYGNVCFQATSKEEIDHIHDVLGKKASIECIENLPFKGQQKTQTRHIKESGIVRLMSAARIAPEKNTLFALKCLQNCHQHVIYDLYGQIYDTGYWDKCQQVITALPANVEVHVHGAVTPEELYTRILEADFLYLPSCGENFGHAIAESLLLNRPVIISDRTPWRNLEKAGVGWDISLEKQMDYSKVIDQCAQMSDNVWDSMSHRTAQFAAQQLHVHETIDKYLQLFCVQ